MQRYRVAIAGCGRMAGTIDDECVDYPALTLPYSHAAAYAVIPRTEMVACADLDPAASERLAVRYGIAHCYGDYREMILAEKPDILSITTPGVSHAEITCFAAENGVRGIYCEKAMACSLDECDAMVEAVERSGASFNLGTNRRWSPGCDKIRELAQDGTLGNITTLIAYWTGNLLHSASHIFDLLLFFAGDAEVEWVQGTVDDPNWDPSHAESEVDLSGTGVIQFRNGIRAYSMQAPLVGEFEVIGDQGTARIMNNGVYWGLRLSREMYSGKWPGLVPVPFPEFERKSATVRCIEDLIQAMETGGPTRGNVRVARAGTEIAFAIVESHRQGGARVSLPLKNRGFYMASW